MMESTATVSDWHSPVRVMVNPDNSTKVGSQSTVVDVDSADAAVEEVVPSESELLCSSSEPSA